MHERSAMRVRTIALPVEHGGWGFLGEPILLGLLVAPSVAGAALAGTTVCAFLARHPSKMFLRNRRRLHVSARYRLAGVFAASYAAMALAALAVAVRRAGPQPLVPFVVAAPALLVYASYDLGNQARRLLPELAAPAGLAATAAAIALAAGWTPLAAAGLWIILASRSLPSVVYVRARLRLERAAPVDRRPVALAHAAAVAIVAALYMGELAPLLTLVALAGLATRAALGLSPGRRPARAKQIGFGELGYGAAYVLATAIGFHLEL